MRQINSNEDKRSFVVSDTLNYYTTFGPPFVSVKVFQTISISNLFFTPKEACIQSLLVRLCLQTPLHIKVAQVAQRRYTAKRERKSVVLLRAEGIPLFKSPHPLSIMWKAAVLAVCLLVSGVQPMDDPMYGVKLCGREFIRAVIFTCGGSRWKRSVVNSGKLLKLCLFFFCFVF